MKRLILILFVFMVMVPMTTVTAAKNYEPQNYATFKIGGFITNDSALDNGVVIGGAIGHMINRNFAVELGTDYTFTDFNYDNDYVYGNADVYTLGIPVTAKYILPLSNQVDLFAGAGVGIYFTGVKFNHHENHEHDGHYYDDDSIHDTSPGFHCLIGADIKMNSYLALTMEMKYTEVVQDFDDYYYDYKYDFEVSGTTVYIGAKFLF